MLSDARIGRLLLGVRKVQGDSTKRPPKLAITTALLLQFEEHFDLLDADDLTIRAASWNATTLLLRMSEFVPSSLTDAAAKRATHAHADTILRFGSLLPPPPAWRLHLQASKTDIFRRGVDLLLCHTRAVGTLTDMLTARRRLSSSAPTPNSPLFIMGNGLPLTRSVLLRRVASLARACGINPALHGGVSFRAGGATSLARAGVPDHLIKVIGRWNSTCYQLYIRTSTAQLQTTCTSF